jgi:luciferase family oxidoreductase group 1
MIPLSILDLSPIAEGGDAAESFRNTLDLARHGERWGYRRFWLAEHHGMPNHAPLVVAEQFGTLASLYPGRIDLGLGRAPGSDQATARALRRTLASDPDEFPQDVLELLDYFAATPSGPVRSVPGAGLDVPVWILGSSLFGAQVAAALGLPYAFASHFAPAELFRAVAVYREHFRPSERLDRPYVMLGFNVFAADTDAEAKLLVTSVQQAVVNLRTGRPTKLPPPVAGYADRLGPAERAILDQVLACSAVGAPDTVAQQMAAFAARTGADELMVTSQIFDHAARLRSYQIAAETRRAVGHR